MNSESCLSTRLEKKRSAKFIRSALSFGNISASTFLNQLGMTDCDNIIDTEFMELASSIFVTQSTLCKFNLGFLSFFHSPT